MPRKPKFRPRITRVKLNPEQAVLACQCYDGFATNAWAVGEHGTPIGPIPYVCKMYTRGGKVAVAFGEMGGTFGPYRASYQTSTASS